MNSLPGMSLWLRAWLLRIGLLAVFGLALPGLLRAEELPNPLPSPVPTRIPTWYMIPIEIANPADTVREHETVAIRLHFPLGVIQEADLTGMTAMETTEQTESAVPADYIKETKAYHQDGSIRAITLVMEVTIQPLVTQQYTVKFGPPAPDQLSNELQPRVEIIRDEATRTATVATEHGAYVIGMRVDINEPISGELPGELLSIQKHREGSLAEILCLNSIKVGDRKQSARIFFNYPESFDVESCALQTTVVFKFSADSLWQPTKQTVWSIPERARACIRLTFQRRNPVIRIESTRTILETIEQFGLAFIATSAFQRGDNESITFDCGPTDYYQALLNILTPAQFERLRRAGLPKASVVTPNLKRIYELHELKTSTVRRLTDYQLTTMSHWFAIHHGNAATNLVYLPINCSPPELGLAWSKFQLGDFQGWALGFDRQELPEGELWARCSLLINVPYLDSRNLERTLDTLDHPLSCKTGQAFAETAAAVAVPSESEIIDISKLPRFEPQKEQPQ